MGAGSPRFPDGGRVIGIEPAAAALQRLYGLEGHLEPLPAEYDANFRVDTGEERLVLKVMRPACDTGLVDLQCALLDHLAASAPDIPLSRVRETLAGEKVGRLEVESGDERLVWLLSWIPGRLLAHTRPHLPGLLESLGSLLGEIDTALAGFSHPAAERDFQWNPARPGWIRDKLDSESHRRRAERVLPRGGTRRRIR